MAKTPEEKAAAKAAKLGQTNSGVDGGSEGGGEDSAPKKFPNQIKPTGKFEVVTFGSSIALFNDLGQRVSPVHGVKETSPDTKDANDKPLLHSVLLAKVASRSNVLRQRNKVAPVKKKNPLAEEAAAQVAAEAAAEGGSDE